MYLKHARLPIPPRPLRNQLFILQVAGSLDLQKRLSWLDQRCRYIRLFPYCKGFWAATVLPSGSAHRGGTPQPPWFQVLVASNVMGVQVT